MNIYEVIGGTLRLMGHNKTYVRGDRFREDPDNINDVVMSKLRLVGEQPVEEPPKVVHHKVVVRSPGWYDVIGPAGKPVNEGALRKGEAQKLLDSL